MTRQEMIELHRALGKLELFLATNGGKNVYMNWKDPRIEDVQKVEQIIEALKL